MVEPSESAVYPRDETWHAKDYYSPAQQPNGRNEGHRLSGYHTVILSGFVHMTEDQGRLWFTLD
jgi:hypothetical protein